MILHGAVCQHSDEKQTYIADFGHHFLGKVVGIDVMLLENDVSEFARQIPRIPADPADPAKLGSKD